MLIGRATRRRQEGKDKGRGEAGNLQQEIGNPQPATARTASATMGRRDPGLRLSGARLAWNA
jgi:hypothetical protein